MLDQMRRGALNWVAKILLLLLIVAFAFWGIGDVFQGAGRGTLATIGKTPITVDEFRQAYQDEIASMSRRLGRRLTPDQAKLLGVEQRALSRLVGGAAIDMHAHDLNLALSDASIADIIRSDPAFQGPTGQFSADRFRQLVRQAGFSEERYVQTRRKEEVRDQLTDTLLSGLAPPQSLIDLVHRYREEKRTIDFITPDYDKLVKVAEPDDAKQREYYEQNKRQFVTPELRKLNLLLLTQDEGKKRVSVTEEEIKAAYESDKESFNIPEKRRIQQLSFPDRAAADKAYAELSKAKSFKDAAAKLGFKESDYDLGEIARRDLIDPKVAEAAFSLKKDELSKPVEGQFATVLLRVGDIKPGKNRPFEEVKAEIKDRIANERAAHEIQTLYDKVEEERSSGKPLKEIADSLKIVFREVPEIDRSGKTNAGQAAIDGPDAGKIAEAAFNAGPGLDAEPVELSEGGYAWLDVAAVTPEKQKPFEEVADEVKTIVTDMEKRREISALAGKFVDRLTKGEATLEALAKEVGAKVEQTGPITRTTTPQGLTNNAVQQAFTLPKGGATSATTADGKGRTVLRVADIIAASPPTPEQSERLKSELTRQMQAETLAEYVGGLEKRYGLAVNEAALRQALGSDRDQQDIQ